MKFNQISELSVQNSKFSTDEFLKQENIFVFVNII